MLKRKHFFAVSILALELLAVTSVMTGQFISLADVSVGVDIPIVGEAPPDRQQVEPTIVVDPRDPSIVVAGAQDLRLKAVGEHRWHGYYRSTDGGQTWSSTLLPGYPGDTSPEGLSSPLHGSNATSDPVMAFDNSGNLYYAGLVFNITRGAIGRSFAFVAKYGNDGATFSGATLIKGPLAPDKPWIAVDTSGGPHDGNVYLVFDANLTATSYYGTLFTRSTDGGRTFSVPFYAPSDETGELPGIAVDSSGIVYVSSDAFNPITGDALNYIQVSTISNGGTTLVRNVNVVNPAFWITTVIQGGGFRAFTIPQIAADSLGVYMVWDDLRLGNANIYFTRSTDSGSSWTVPLMVNDVLTGQHFFPTIAVSGGIINVAWYDSRFNTGSTLTSLDLFYSQSTDGGASFLSSTRVTSVSFNPELVKRTDELINNAVFMGDYIGIAATPTAVHPVWADNRNACDTVDPVYGCVDQDVFTATISVSPPAPVYDVGVYGLTPSRNFDYNSVPSNSILLNVTATNLGSTQETFKITFKANSTIIGSQNVTLPAGTSALVSLSWHAELLSRARYNVTTGASTVTGETKTANNYALDNTVFAVRLGGDVNNDCTVNILDLVRVGLAFSSSAGPPASSNWNPNADLNNDRTVNIVDLVAVGLKFNQGC